MPPRLSAYLFGDKGCGMNRYKSLLFFAEQLQIFHILGVCKLSMASLFLGAGDVRDTVLTYPK
jgi:hypothetical protein